MNEIDAAVAWWVTRLDSDKPVDIGDARGEAMHESAKAILTANSDNAKKQELIQNIAQAMRKRLEKELKKLDRYGASVVLEFDYHPEGVMLEIIRDAGVPDRQYDLYFPSKVSMKVGNGFVFVYDGYSADREVIYGELPAGW